MNKRGQALVEFIIVMPIFIMILLAAFDFVNIIQTKMTLENAVEELIVNENIILDKDIKFQKEKDSKYVKYKLSKDVNITSPFLTLVIENDYKVVVERSIYAKQ